MEGLQTGNPLELVGRPMRAYCLFDADMPQAGNVLKRSAAIRLRLINKKEK